MRYATVLAKKAVEGQLDTSDYSEYEDWYEEKRQAIKGVENNLREKVKTTDDACELACQWVEEGKYTKDEMLSLAKSGRDIEGVPGWLFLGYVRKFFS